MLINYTALFLKHLFPQVVFSKFSVKKIFVADVNYIKATKQKKEPLFCVLIDCNGKYLPEEKRYENVRKGRENFERELVKIRQHEDYRTDYPGDWDSNTHVVLFNTNHRQKKQIISFMKGLYSEIYTDTELRRFKIREDSFIYSVVRKTEERKREFEELVNRNFDTNLVIEDDDERELFFKPSPQEEILNGYNGFSFDE